MVSDKLAGRLRHALESGSFEQARELTADLRAATRQDLRSAASLSDRMAIARTAADLLQENLLLAQVKRAHLATQMAAIVRLISYRDTPQIESTWQVDC